MDHWSRDSLLQRRLLLGTLITVIVLLWTPPALILITLAVLVWPLGALEASSASRLRRVRSLAHAAA